VLRYLNDRFKGKIPPVREIKMENFFLKPTFHYSNIPSFHFSGIKTYRVNNVMICEHFKNSEIARLR
jgi:hypothetical protein